MAASADFGVGSHFYGIFADYSSEKNIPTNL
jgi:hypothetical protein